MKINVSTLLLTTILAGLLLGCASARQKCRTEITHPDGTIEVRETEAKVTALWDAKQSMDKVRVSNGRAQSIGASAVESEASSTNIVAGVDALTRLTQSLK